MAQDVPYLLLIVWPRRCLQVIANVHRCVGPSQVSVSKFVAVLLLVVVCSCVCCGMVDSLFHCCVVAFRCCWSLSFVLCFWSLSLLGVDHHWIFFMIDDA